MLYARDSPYNFFKALPVFVIQINGGIVRTNSAMWQPTPLVNDPLILGAQDNPSRLII